MCEDADPSRLRQESETDMYEFYREGFFGYGEKGDFQFYSIWHIVPLLVIALSLALIILFRDKLRSWKGDGRFRFIFAFIMLMVEMSFFWRLLYVGNEYGAHSLMTLLPFQVCQWGLYCAAFAMMSENETLLGINFFATLGLTGAALFIPSVIVRTGPSYYRYYQFWIEHGFPVIAVVYMMAVHGKKPRYWHLWLTVGLLMLLSIPSVIANHRIPNANYMYLGNYVPGSEFTVDPLSFMPQAQLPRYLITMAIVVSLFHGLYFLWKWIYTAYRRRHGERANMA